MIGLLASEPHGLLATQQSLLDQDYRHWRLFLTPELPLLPELAEDTRVSRIESPAAVCSAGCSWLGVLPGGLTLLPGALQAFARRASQSPSADLLFCDEDEGDLAKRTSHPNFKPGWQPDLRLTHDQLGAFPVARPSLVDRVAAQAPPPYDRASRLAFNLELSFAAVQVAHIAETLVHRSAVLLPYTTKDEQSDAANRYLRLHALPGAIVTHPLTGCLRLLAPASVPRLVSVILLGEDRQAAVETATDVRTAHPASVIEIIWATVNPTAPLPGATELSVAPEPPFDHVIRAGRGSAFSRCANLGARTASGDVLVFIRAGLETPSAPWLSTLLEHALRPDVCAVGARICSPEGTVLHSGYILNAVDGSLRHAGAGLSVSDPGPQSFALCLRNVSGVSIDCLCITSARFAQLDGFRILVQALHSSLDLCLRGAQQGWLNIITPFCDMVVPASDVWEAGNLSPCPRFWSFWAGHLPAVDPFYNSKLPLAMSPTIEPATAVR